MINNPLARTIPCVCEDGQNLPISGTETKTICSNDVASNCQRCSAHLKCIVGIVYLFANHSLWKIPIIQYKYSPLGDNSSTEKSFVDEYNVFNESSDVTWRLASGGHDWKLFLDDGVPALGMEKNKTSKIFGFTIVPQSDTVKSLVPYFSSNACASPVQKPTKYQNLSHRKDKKGGKNETVLVPHDPENYIAKDENNSSMRLCGVSFITPIAVENEFNFFQNSIPQIIPDNHNTSCSTDSRVVGKSNSSARGGDSLDKNIHDVNKATINISTGTTDSHNASENISPSENCVTSVNNCTSNDSIYVSKNVDLNQFSDSVDIASSNIPYFKPAKESVNTDKFPECDAAMGENVCDKVKSDSSVRWRSINKDVCSGKLPNDSSTHLDCLYHNSLSKVYSQTKFPLDIVRNRKLKEDEEQTKRNSIGACSFIRDKFNKIYPTVRSRSVDRLKSISSRENSENNIENICDNKTCEKPPKGIFKSKTEVYLKFDAKEKIESENIKNKSLEKTTHLPSKPCINSGKNMRSVVVLNLKNNSFENFLKNSNDEKYQKRIKPIDVNAVIPYDEKSNACVSSDEVTFSGNLHYCEPTLTNTVGSLSGQMIDVKEHSHVVQDSASVKKSQNLPDSRPVNELNNLENGQFATKNKPEIDCKPNEIVFPEKISANLCQIEFPEKFSENFTHKAEFYDKYSANWPQTEFCSDKATDSIYSNKIEFPELHSENLSHIIQFPEKHSAILPQIICAPDNTELDQIPVNNSNKKLENESVNTSFCSSPENIDNRNSIFCTPTENMCDLSFFTPPESLTIIPDKIYSSTCAISLQKHDTRDIIGEYVNNIFDPLINQVSKCIADNTRANIINNRELNYTLIRTGDIFDIYNNFENISTPDGRTTYVETGSSFEDQDNSLTFGSGTDPSCMKDSSASFKSVEDIQILSGDSINERDAEEEFCNAGFIMKYSHLNTKRNSVTSGEFHFSSQFDSNCSSDVKESDFVSEEPAALSDSTEHFQISSGVWICEKEPELPIDSRPQIESEFELNLNTKLENVELGATYISEERIPDQEQAFAFETGPVARRDIPSLEENWLSCKWKPPEYESDQSGYETDEEFDTVDEEMKRLEEKLKKFEEELGKEMSDESSEENVLKTNVPYASYSTSHIEKAKRNRTSAHSTNNSRDRDENYSSYCKEGTKRNHDDRRCFSANITSNNSLNEYNLYRGSKDKFHSKSSQSYNCDIVSTDVLGQQLSYGYLWYENGLPMVDVEDDISLNEYPDPFVLFIFEEESDSETIDDTSRNEDDEEEYSYDSAVMPISTQLPLDYNTSPFDYTQYPADIPITAPCVELPNPFDSNRLSHYPENISYFYNQNTQNNESSIDNFNYLPNIDSYDGQNVTSGQYTPDNPGDCSPHRPKRKKKKRKGNRQNKSSVAQHSRHRRM